MISTVTTTAVTIVTIAALTGTLGLFLTITLVACLIKKEIVFSNSDPRARVLNRTLNAVIVPLLMVFILLAMSKLYEFVNV